MNKVTSLQPILDCFAQQSIRGVTELSHFLQKDRTLIHRYLKELVARGKLSTVGLGAHTKYQLVAKQKTATEPDQGGVFFSAEQIDILDRHFVKFAVNGKKLTGKLGFIQWCNDRKLDSKEKITSFVQIAKYLESVRNKYGLIDVTKDFRDHIEGSAIDELYFADQYKRMEFGRGKLAELTYYAKDTGNITSIHKCIDMIKDKLELLIHKGGINAIAFTPHSKKRPIQLLKETQKRIDLQGLPLIKIVKYAPYGTIITQKSLKTREQRIQNAKETILIEHEQLLKQYKTVLLIDDFVGSGATLNETAKKLKAFGVKKVIGFAFVGNANLSYEVINEI